MVGPVSYTHLDVYKRQVLTTYWPQELIGVDALFLPQIEQLQSIDGYKKPTTSDADFALPTVLRSGSVGGPATLGWGDPASDFFAMSTGDTARALQTIASSAQRLWHYRLYDLSLIHI